MERVKRQKEVKRKSLNRKATREKQMLRNICKHISVAWLLPLHQLSISYILCVCVETVTECVCYLRVLLKRIDFGEKVERKSVCKVY